MNMRAQLPENVVQNVEEKLMALKEGKGMTIEAA